MKKYLIILVLFYVKSFGQLSPNKNYISVIKPKEPVTTSEITSKVYSKNQEVNYFDGFGRNMQNVIIGITPLGNDLIYPIEYDNRGLKSKDYLPYPSSLNNNGAFSNQAISNATLFYTQQFPEEVLSIGPTNSMNSFSEKVIEDSPLLREIEISSPGKDWRASNFASVYNSPAYSYSWSASEFVNGTVAGGSPITFNLNTNGLLNINFNFGGPDFKFNLGNIKFLGYVPDADLGYIKNGGVSTSYFLSIKNGYLNISSSRSEPLQSVSSSFSYQFDKKITRINSGNTTKIENGTNKANQVVRYDVEFDSSKNPRLVYKNFYEQSRLFKTIVRDENWQPAYHMEWAPNDFSYLNGAITGSNVVLDIKKGILSLSINVSASPWSIIKTGVVKTLDFEVNDIDLGNLIDINSNIPLYNVYIQKNNLCIKRIYTGVLSQPARFNSTLTSNVLYYNKPNDETGNLEFKDFSDRLILKRTMIGDQVYDTQYVYDNSGNLTYVIPPLAAEVLLTSFKNATTDSSSNVIISSGNTLNLTASNSITLFPGFHAQLGSNFTATIGLGSDTSSILNELCYQYKYDYSNRLIEKKIPGKGWESIVYDKLDRVVLTQDANLKAQGKWLFTKYDIFNRTVYTGEFTSAQSREALQIQVNGAAILSEKRQSVTTIGDSSAYYTNLVFPTTSINLFTVNYYDNYGFDLAGGTTEASFGNTPVTNVKGLATGSKIRTLGTTQWTTNVQYYDAKGRQIYTFSKNEFLSTVDKIKNALDFTGKVIQTETRHQKGTNAVLVLLDNFEYDQADRLLTQKQSINGSAQEIITSNTYDSLGQLVGKGVGGKVSQNRLQNVDYKYNIRGWLRGINDVNTIGSDLFSFKVNYNTPTDMTKALFNGNISQTLWKTATMNTTVNPVSNAYTFSYDGLNRLISGVDNTTNYNESLNYDKNGNILNILRKGNLDENATSFGIMDNLVFTYDKGNKLMKVEDSGSIEGFNNGTSGSQTDFTYDGNGNMLRDTNKLITTDILYNHLDLPTKIKINGAAAMTGRTWSADILYTYDATGKKLSKKVTKTEYLLVKGEYKFVTTLDVTTHYAGGFQYENNLLQFFPTAEGYVEHNSGNYSYVYQYRDHLGNVRLAYKDSNNDGAVTAAEILSEDNYYPFGLKHKGYNSNLVNSNNKYKYNGKELQDELGLNMYDYGARNYDPALGRWMNVDPLAEVIPNESPYTYCSNNPIIFIDPTGMFKELPDNQKLGKGDWHKSDRINHTPVWDKANEYNIKHNRKGQYEPYEQVAAFYNWVDDRSKDLGQEVKWMEGAHGLVKTLEINRALGAEAFIGDDVIKVLEKLNVAIADATLTYFKDLLYSGKSYTGEKAYKWDVDFITYEQGTIAVPIYEGMDKTTLNKFNAMANGKDSKAGWYKFLSNFNYIDFGKYNANVWDKQKRIDIPLNMLYGKKHKVK